MHAAVAMPQHTPRTCAPTHPLVLLCALQAACLARCNGSRVETYLYGDVGVEEFRQMVREACSSGTQHIIVSYSRKEFLQTGKVARCAR